MSKKKIKLIIAGSRSIQDYNAVKKYIEQGLKELKLCVSDITEVISGHAKGVDKLGEQWAHENKIKVRIFEAEWNNIKREGARIETNQYGKKYDKLAGFHRNQQMADYADVLIAINEGTNGTDHMVKTMKEQNKTFSEIKINEKDENFTHSF